MNSKEITQSGSTAPAGVMTLNNSQLGWRVSDYAQHQVQIGVLASGETATLYTISPSARTGQWVKVQEVLGSDASTHMIVLTPDSGRHANLKVEFSNTSGSALVTVGSHYSAAHHFAL